MLSARSELPDLIAGASRILLLAVGKAAAGMALEIQRRVGDRLADGIAVVPRDSAVTAEPDSILKKKIRFVAVESSCP